MMTEQLCNILYEGVNPVTQTSDESIDVPPRFVGDTIYTLHLLNGPAFTSL